MVLSRVERGCASTAYPLSYSQQQMWVLYEMDRESAAYSVPREWWLNGQLSMCALTGAVQSVAAQHEMRKTIRIQKNRLSLLGLDVVETGMPMVCYSL